MNHETERNLSTKIAKKSKGAWVFEKNEKYQREELVEKKKA